MPKGKSIPVDLSQEDALLSILPYSPVLSSYKAGWNGIYLECFRHYAHEFHEMQSKQHVLAVQLHACPVQSERRMDGRFQKERVLEGNICLIPANTRHWTYGFREDGAEEDYMLLCLEPTVFAHSIYEAVDPAPFELVPHFAQSDPLIYQIGLALKAELETDGLGTRLYAESATAMLSAHLLRHYSTQKCIIKDYTGGLPKHKLRQVMDYINAHLDHDLSLAELTAPLKISPHYFSHLFKQSTGLTPHQYVIRCRVERAKQLLRQSRLPIAEVANSVGFANQGHLNHHFKRLVGVTPKLFQQNSLNL